MKKLAILVSGRGSNMQAIINACEQGYLDASIEVVISNNTNSQALIIAKRKNIDAIDLSTTTYSDPEKLDRAMLDVFIHYKIDLVLLAGFIKKIGPCTLASYKYKILNIHPSLLPKFGGVGMYGMKVHEAVVNSGEKKTGVTIHLIDDDYDTGKILAQRSISIKPTDTAKSIAARVLKLEHMLYAETVKKIIEGSILLPTA